MKTPLTNALRKEVHGLAQAKNRRESRLFTAEGTKSVLDTLGAFQCVRILATHAWLEDNAAHIHGLETVQCTRADMERITALSTAPDVIAVFRMPNAEQPNIQQLAQVLTIALDRVQDPGNLGTIVRLADWMGIDTILASHDTADVYNPKTVQATMGSLARVRVVYCDLPTTLSSIAALGAPVYGTFLDGKNIYGTQLQNRGVLVMGNEGRGISAEVAATVSHRLYIPPYPANRQGAESLNVAVATAIATAEFRRQASLNP